MVDIREKINKTQLQIVESTEGPLLVVAGAGSGKTRVIEYRVLHLIQKGIPAHQILLLTFTRRAAQEMLLRASRHDRRCSAVEGGTFHSFSYKLLRQYGNRIGLKDFSILDEADALDAVNVCLKESGYAVSDKDFPRKDYLRKMFSMQVNKRISLDKVLEDEYPDFVDYQSQIEELGKRYKNYKKSKQYLDYDDLLAEAINLLTQEKVLCNHIGERYNYLMVDEYQDTNPLQAELTFLLGKTHCNVMAVGDDAQSIYGFRGASHRNIMEFPQKFPGCKILKLEANYRSHQKILDVANAVLLNMRNKYSKCLKAVQAHIGEVPQLLIFRGDRSEAEWITEKIQSLKHQGFDYQKQAILFRSAYISIPLQAQLSRMGIPFQVYGGMKFYETAHVKDLLAHLKVMANPADDISWMRIFTLLDGVGPKTAGKIIAGFKHPKAKEVTDMIKDFSQEKKKIGQLLSGVADYYYPLLKEKFEDWRQRSSDIDALLEIAENYDSLVEFLADFALDPPEKAVNQDANKKQETLTLSTIHSAKGLEWDCVFVLGLMDGVLPVSFSLSNDERIEEEMRLLYVAITRAKVKLHLVAHYEGFSSGTNQFHKISRFLDSPAVMAHLSQKAIFE